MNWKSLLAAVVGFFSHIAVNDKAAVAKLQQVEQGIGLAHDVVSALPDGNSKTAALSALDKAGAYSVQAVNIAHTVDVVLSEVAPEPVSSSSSSSASSISSATAASDVTADVAPAASLNGEVAPEASAPAQESASTEAAAAPNENGVVMGEG